MHDWTSELLDTDLLQTNPLLGNYLYRVFGRDAPETLHSETETETETYASKTETRPRRSNFFPRRDRDRDLQQPRRDRDKTLPRLETSRDRDVRRDVRDRERNVNLTYSAILKIVQNRIGQNC